MREVIRLIADRINRVTSTPMINLSSKFLFVKVQFIVNMVQNSLHIILFKESEGRET
jgi:hypothetical protein